MRARVKKTGEIKSFYPTTQSGYDGYVDEDGEWYYPKELDFTLSEPEEEEVIEGWVCKDEYEDGFARIHTEEPSPSLEEVALDDFIEVWRSSGNVYLISDYLFPDLKHTDTPKKVTITIKQKKK